MKKVIKNNYKFILGIIVGLIISVIAVYAVDAYIESNKVTYNNHNKNNVEEAIDELYERSGVHKDKWIDPVLNGADPVLKEPLLPVEIKPNGEVYYANENSEWYNYSEKRWANAIILVDSPSNTNYQVGDHIIEDDIESYFVWIPRYQYKVWNLGNYTDTYKFSQISDVQNNSNSNTAFWKMAGSDARIIEIKFGDVNSIPNMSESETAIGKFYTHPAFTLGDKNLNGMWVGKFETGYKNANSTESAQVDQEDSESVIIKPNVYSWHNFTFKNMFLSSYNYERKLDSHMLKNTEWGAVAYLSHSKYGIGKEVNINNVSEYMTGYSATESTNQNTYPGETAEHTDGTKTQPYNTEVGYLASTTGNISGIYDMSGGAHEYVAACITSYPGESGFSLEELSKYFNLKYLDKYADTSSTRLFNSRILGDATGEMGPFYTYYEEKNWLGPHNNWYADMAFFVDPSTPLFVRGLPYDGGVLAGQFAFARPVSPNQAGFRVALAIN